MGNFPAQFKVYLVGGAVRDRLLGLAVKDCDYVVVGATVEEMLALGFKAVGQDFPVFLHPKTGEEYALARTERKAGQGYRGFKVYADKTVTLEADLLRRDLTVNAMAQDATGQIIDPYGGQADIERKRLRHVSSAFSEDPLRVLRLLRFEARFAELGFGIAEETWQLALEMVAQGELRHLSSERVWVEVEKALLTPTPALFFQRLQALAAMGVLSNNTIEQAPAFEAMQAALVSVAARSGDSAMRLAAWLSADETFASVAQQALPLPKRYRFWLTLFTQHRATLLDWAHADAASRLALFKASNSLRTTGEIERFAQALGGDEGLRSHLRAKQAQLQALIPQDFMAQGLTGQALGEALEQAQLEILSTP